MRVPDTGSEMSRQGIDPEPLFVLLRLKPNRQTAASRQEGLKSFASCGVLWGAVRMHAR